MYRKSLQQDKMKEVDDIQFVSRVGSLPIITTAVGQLGTIYQYTKAKNPVFKYTLETAEAGFKVATNTSKPIMDKLNKPSKYIYMLLLVDSMPLLNGPVLEVGPKLIIENFFCSQDSTKSIDYHFKKKHQQYVNTHPARFWLRSRKIYKFQSQSLRKLV